MITMAIRTVRCVRISLCMLFTMFAHLVVVYWFGVAHGAIDFSAAETYRIPRIADRNVAFDACNRAVSRAEQGFGVNEQRNVFSVDGFVEVLVAMAPYTHLVGEALRVQHSADDMRRVAVYADGDLVRPLLPHFSVDHFLVNLFDQGMALHARAGDVIPIDR